MGSALKIVSLAACFAVAVPLAGDAFGAPHSEHRPSDLPRSILPRPGADTSPRNEALARLNAIVDAEKQLPLQQGSQTRVYLQPGQAKGTLVMYHGFTAGTWQFEILARRAYAAGYHVYVPRLPGHGLRDDSGGEDPRQLLTGRNWRDYETFAGSTCLDVKGLGAPISVIGLSVGGAVALSAAEQHPGVLRVAVFAPFLEVAGPAKVAIQVGRVLNGVTFGLAARAFGLLPVHWSRDIQIKTASGERPGHTKFSQACIHAVTLFGREILENAAQLKAPVQFVTTAGDPAADEATNRNMFDLLGGSTRNGWYQYPRPERVPHAMIHPYEDGGAGHTAALYDVTMQFLETGRLINRP